MIFQKSFKIFFLLLVFIPFGLVLLHPQSITNNMNFNKISTQVPGRPDGWTFETHHKNAEANYRLVFDDSCVNQITIIIPQEEYKIMEKDITQYEMGNDKNPIFAPVTVIFNKHTWKYVGMRYKGNSTLTAAIKKGHKLPFRLDFDHYENKHPEISGQRFYGFEKMTFSNNYYDASFLREKLCADIFRQGGVQAARGAFYRVFVDNGDVPIYWGLYTMIEEPSDVMLYNQFGSIEKNQYGVKGNLYKPQGDAARWTTFDEQSFIKKTNKKAADFKDIQMAIEALHASRKNPELWRNKLEKSINIKSFIRWIAINTAIVNWDSYGIMAHNYYLYQNPADNGRLTWFPWDLNMSMDLKNSPDTCLTLALNEVEDDWPLIRYVMDDPVYNKLYHQELAHALEGCINESLLIPRIKKLHQMIRPYIIGKKGELKGYSYLTRGSSEFDEALVELENHIKERNKAVRNYLNSRY